MEILMNKKHNALNVITAVLFMALILTPAILLFTTGQDKTVLDGEKQYEVPAFSVGSFISAEFQGDFEKWFSTKYPYRANVVSAYRKLQFDTSNIGFDITMLFAPKLPAEVDPVIGGDGTEIIEEITFSSSNYLYTSINERLANRAAVENTGYKGTDQVVIGKSGYCYENGYINELYGYSPKYRNCSDTYLKDRIEKVEYIQKALEKRGIKFIYVITPSKASEYERFIPDWYKAQYTAAENYVRPVDRFVALLKENGINYINSADLYDEVGLDETFPLTGIHWNKPAAVETTVAMLNKYGELAGKPVKNLKTVNVNRSEQPCGYGNPEMDIFNIAYSGLDTTNAIKDEYYYESRVSLQNEDAETFGMLIQGGSFCGDFDYYLGTYGIVDKYSRFYYNSWWGDPALNPFGEMGNAAWEEILRDIDCVVFECNEQFICTMGTDAPRWGAEDRVVMDGYSNGNDVYESLYKYLKSAE